MYDFYMFMNKDKPLFSLYFIDGKASRVEDLIEENIEFLPPALYPYGTRTITHTAFNGWWINRCAPVTRHGVKQFLWDRDQDDLTWLAEQTLGMNLSDHYWLNPDDSLEWQDVSMFLHDYTLDFGRKLLALDASSDKLFSPDVCTLGSTRKWWSRESGVNYLYKQSDTIYGDLSVCPVREFFAYNLLKEMVKDTAYQYMLLEVSLHYGEIGLASKSKCMVDENTEYISCNSLMRQYRKSATTTLYNHIKSFYPNNPEYVDIMILLDYLILNEDRHTSNFGILRNVETGESVPAPFFAHGRSLHYKSTCISLTYAEAKPFSTEHLESVDLVDVKKYYEIIARACKSVDDIFDKSFVLSEESDDRRKAIKVELHKRCNTLLKHARGKKILGLF